MMPEAEAKQFVTAWQNVLRHYPIAVTQKAFDWAMCASIMAYVHVPRVHKTLQLRRARQGGQRPAAQVLRFAQTPGPRPGNGAPPMDSMTGKGVVTPAAGADELGIMAEGPPDSSAMGDSV